MRPTYAETSPEPDEVGSLRAAAAHLGKSQSSSTKSSLRKEGGAGVSLSRQPLKFIAPKRLGPAHHVHSGSEGLELSRPGQRISGPCDRPVLIKGSDAVGTLPAVLLDGLNAEPANSATPMRENPTPRTILMTNRAGVCTAPPTSGALAGNGHGQTRSRPNVPEPKRSGGGTEPTAIFQSGEHHAAFH